MNDAKPAQQDPVALGFRMPPEWHPHAGTWLSWPSNNETWPHNLTAAQDEFLQLVQAVAKDEPVAVVLDDDIQADLFNSRIAETGLPIWTVRLPTNDAWMRDYGLTFVHSSEKLVGIDWQYNAWGGKYPPFDQDQLAGQRMIESMPPHFCPDEGVERFQSSLCLEGGALEIDANGILLCTKSCALDPNRNSQPSEDAIEHELKHCLGARHVIWLEGDAILGDDTDGHIDQLARFCHDSILYAWTDDRNDPQFTGLEKNREDLAAGIDRLRLGYKMRPLPLPDPVEFRGHPLPASYCNFYITNRSVIVPQFDRPQDEAAIEIIGQCFPERKTFGLPSTHLTVGLGSFHCLTQQQPTWKRITNA